MTIGWTHWLGGIATGALGLATAAAWATHQSPAVGISISYLQPLAFGEIAAGSGGSVIVSPSGVATTTGGVVLLASSSASPATFRVYGSADLSYDVVLPGNSVVSLTSASGHSMSVNNFTSIPASAGLLSGAGSEVISVGATLSVAPGQSPGAYSGSFDITVEYN